jgi:hypothetical protein
MIKEDANIEEMLKNVEHSTESALTALSQLEQNLMRGRFKEGIAPYEVMCKTLVGQRIWTSDKNNEKINKNFKQISNTARNIIDILMPYVQNLEKLAVIDGEIVFEDEQISDVVHSIDDEVLNNEKPAQDEDKVMTVLKKSPRKKMSYTKLRSSLGWERKKLNEVLKTIAENTGAIAITTSGSRKMITLKS